MALTRSQWGALSSRCVTAVDASTPCQDEPEVAEAAQEVWDAIDRLKTAARAAYLRAHIVRLEHSITTAKAELAVYERGDTDVPQP